MTQNQIRYYEYLENARHNLVFEGLTSRGQDLSLYGTQTIAAANRYGAELSSAAHRYSAELASAAQRYSTNAGFLSGMGQLGTQLLPWFFVPARDRRDNSSNGSQGSSTPRGGMLALPAPDTDYTREEKIKLTEEANRQAGELRRSGALQQAADFFTGFVDYSRNQLEQAAQSITSRSTETAWGGLAGVFSSMPAWMWAIG